MYIGQMRRLLILTVILLVLSGISLSLEIYFSHKEPRERCQILRHSILDEIARAKEIRVVEHSCRWDFLRDNLVVLNEKIYKTIVLTPSQVTQLKTALFPSLDHSGNTFLSCIFEPHHRLEIVRPDNSVFVIEICFVCGELDVGAGQRILPDGWENSLKTFISSLSLRPDGPWTVTDSPAKSE